MSYSVHFVIVYKQLFYFTLLSFLPLCVCVHTTYRQVPMEARKGHWVLQLELQMAVSTPVHAGN